VLDHGVGLVIIPCCWLYVLLFTLQKIILPRLLRLEEMCLRIAHVMTPTLASSTRTRTVLATYYLVGQGFIAAWSADIPASVRCVHTVLQFRTSGTSVTLLFRETYIFAEPLVRDLYLFGLPESNLIFSCLSF
jgi:hypothetical protein